ncbi:MAG TPA: patatin-like phospholipase family protein, partial [Nitrospiraceae bacterium]
MRAHSEEQGRLYLSTVLSEEYAALHGPLPQVDAASTEEDRLASIHTLIHKLPGKRTALCLSGGGIRSATFGLGVLTGLARLKILEKFDYLSTVSGGGYIGSWLTAWVSRHPQGITGVAEELRQSPVSAQYPDVKPVVWLRQYSNYLSPRLGLLSADSWTLLGTYLRNLLLNWLILVPLLVAALMVPRLMVSLIRWNVAELGFPQSMPTSALVVGLLLTILALTYLHVSRPSLEKFRTQDFWKPFERQQWFLILGLIPLVLATCCLSAAWAWFRNAGGQLDQLAAIGLNSRTTFVLSGGAIHFAGWLISTILLRRFVTGRWFWVEMLVIFWSGALGGLFLWSILAELPAHHTVAEFAEWQAAFGVPGILSLFLLVATVYLGVSSRYTDDHDREWWGRSGAWTLIAATTWSTISALVIFGPGLMASVPAVATSLGGLSGLITLVLGFSSRTTATSKGKASLIDLIFDQAVKLAAPVFMIFLLVVISLWTSLLLKGLAEIHGIPTMEWSTIGLRMSADVWGHAVIIHNSPLWLLVEWGLAFVCLAVAMSLVININKFSLHSMYRNRLIRAYLGASRLKEYGVELERRPNRFTGFDPNDNLELHQLAPSGQPVRRPFHILNIALNLVRGEKLAWQQRKAQSFTTSPLHCGSWNLGYRRSSVYGSNHRIGKAISLGTAMAMSGAAASPNMGYHSAAAVTFLLAFFNVRLGWWLGNPGDAGKLTYDRSCPRIAVRPLLAETFGLTDADNPYVY